MSPSNSPREPVLIEGYTSDELLAAASTELAPSILSGQPITFRIGSAAVLGLFAQTDESLHIELAHIDGGGEGVLSTLWSLAERYAESRGLAEIRWTVHAVHCANPNPKLRRILDRRGFQRVTRDGSDVYELVTCLPKPQRRGS